MKTRTVTSKNGQELAQEIENEILHLEMSEMSIISIVTVYYTNLGYQTTFTYTDEEGIN